MKYVIPYLINLGIIAALGVGHHLGEEGFMRLGFWALWLLNVMQVLALIIDTNEWKKLVKDRPWRPGINVLSLIKVVLAVYVGFAFTAFVYAVLWLILWAKAQDLSKEAA